VVFLFYERSRERPGNGPGTAREATQFKTNNSKTCATNATFGSQLSGAVPAAANVRSIKGGAADPCPFLARGRGPSDGGTMWDAPQGFRSCLPPSPIWPETRLRLRDLSASCQRELEEGAGRGCPDDQVSIYSWTGHKSGSGLSGLTPSILHYNWFWDNIC
jgi:hypothetical protein